MIHDATNFFAGLITFGVIGGMIITGLYIAWKQDNKRP